MDDTDAHPALRIERGRASDEELAALTAVLLLALQQRAATDTDHRPAGPAGRARWSRRPSGHRGSRSWQ
ncbi:acyl-CoA carboxylase epsilon subunit [Streptomyces flaveolus]|uniref:acyl-CoA carboxylase epsilon subunit n=1 Tax=Streptomyces flaveolus TaxID=67297 RepID=UPI0038001A82